jgi:hypothetical protein
VSAEPQPDNPQKTIRRFTWPILIAALAVLGVLLALANMSLNTPLLGPFSEAVVGPSMVAVRADRLPASDRFERTKNIQALSFTSPFRPIGPVSPLQALRALLSNGAGLIFIALAVLVIFPSRARSAVERIEARNGPAIALGAGVATLLLTLAAVLLLRFTLVYLVLVPVLLAFAVAVAIFGLACIALALGRQLEHRFQLETAHPLVVSLAGTLLVFDLAVIPYAGVFALAALGIAGLGLAVVSRFGSTTGWSFADLNW